jgi:sugar lactone lactonase YvrE
MPMGEPVCVAPSGDRCGEGPLWHPEEQALYWTDINRFLAHRWNAADGSVKTWFFDEPVTALALTAREDTLAVALGSRVILWSPRTDARRDQGFRLDGWPAVRLNEGRVDPRGSLWLGSMRNNVRPDGSAGEAGGTDGALYRVDPDGAASEWKRGIGIANTLAWSPDETRLYFADTLANRIWVYDYDPSTGAIGGERTFFADFPRGLPDGSAMDREGFLWNCRHGGGCVVRIAPDGRVDQVAELPVTNVTSCIFGGEDRRTLYVTSAANGAPEGERMAGSVFAIGTDVKGLTENRFGVTE